MKKLIMTLTGEDFDVMVSNVSEEQSSGDILTIDAEFVALPQDADRLAAAIARRNEDGGEVTFRSANFEGGK